MAIDILGTISVAVDGTVTKSGECEHLYDLLYAAAESAMADSFPGQSLPEGPESVALKRGIALQATALATYIRTLLLSRATATITFSTSGLQRTPNPNNPNTPTLAPATDQFLSIV